MAFPFRNMQNFIRNCIEPHTVALNQILMSANQKLKSDVAFEIEELKKLFTAYQLTIDNRFNSLKSEVQTTVNSLSTIPVGMIAIWPTGLSISEPSKWRDCDGSGYSTSTYRKLWEVLQSPYLPDYRGRVFYGNGGGAPGSGSFYVGMSYAGGWQHNDGIIQLQIGNITTGSGNSAAGPIQRSEGSVNVSSANYQSVRYIIRVLP